MKSFLIAGLLTLVHVHAHSMSYIRVVLSEGSEVYAYRVSPSTLALTLKERCSERSPSACAFATDPAYQADLAERKSNATLVLARFKDLPSFAVTAADSTLQHAVIAESGAGHSSPYKFELHNLQTGTVELTKTTKRRISAAALFGSRGCFVLLTSSYRIGMKPWELVLSLAGHPPQYDTYYLEVYSSNGTVLNELLVHKDLRNSSGFLVPHVEDETAVQKGSNSPC